MILNVEDSSGKCNSTWCLKKRRKRSKKSAYALAGPGGMFSGDQDEK